MSGVYKTEAWLNKYGWTKGKGLGKNENGIKDFIKLDKKDDTVGLGGESYAIRDFNWWDSIYTKAAQKLKIESTADGKSVVHVEQPKAEVPQEKKYGVFVKSKEPDNFSSNIREEELIKVCEGRQLKASMTGKLARLEEQEKQVISSNTLRISKKRGQENGNDDSNDKINKKQHKEAKKTPYGSNYRPLVLPEKIVQTGDKVQQQKESAKEHNNTDHKEDNKKSKKNKKRKRSEIESTEEQVSNSKSSADNTKLNKTKQASDKGKATDTKPASNGGGFFFFNYDNENKKLDESQKDSTPRPTSIEEVYSDGTERMSKSARRKAKKQRTK